MRSVETMIVRYALLLFLVLGVVVVSFYELDRLNAQSREIEATSADVRGLLRLQLDEESGLRGYVATDERLFLQPYYAAQPQMSRLLDSLFRRVSPRPQDVTTLKHFALLHAAWERNIAYPTLHRADTSNVAREQAGKALVDRMRADVARIRASYDAFAIETTARARWVAGLAEVLILLCILAIAGVGYYMERRRAVREEEMFSEVMLARDSANRMSDWRSKVIAMLAHDFRSTLAGVRAYSELLEDFPERRSDPQVYRGIRQATDQLRHMADEALLMARLTSGNLQVQVEPLAIWPVLNEVADRYRTNRTVHLPPSFATVMGDRDYLVRVFDNLLSNAVKYSPDSTPIGVDITEASSGRVQISVKNAGRGIAPEELPHAFDEYWRGSTAPKGTGSGIGLFIVKKIVDAHQGSISIESRPDAGTTVHVQLPAAYADDGSVAAQGETELAADFRASS